MNVRPMARILLIEADEAVAVALQRGFHRVGWNVAWGRTAHAALLLKAGFKPQVVLLALDIPDMNSSALIERLAHQRDCSVVVISGQGEGARRRALEDGAHDYLQKPLTIREIMACVQALQQQLAPSGAPDGCCIL